MRRTNRVVYVDLGRRSVETSELGPDMVGAFLGDGAVGFRLAYDLIRPGADCLAPEVPIIISAGALTGTRAQAPRWSLVARMPLGGCVTLSSGGMSFGVRLRRAGYDQLVVTGRAPRPVYLKVDDSHIEICDAGGLWGQDAFDTTDALWKKLGKQYGILAIGPAGENLVRISVALVDRMSSIGKGGIPAIMGSKNLKAVVVRGGGEVGVAQRGRFERACDALLARYQSDPKLQARAKLGKLSFDYGSNLRLAFRNAREIFPRDRYRQLYGSEVYASDAEFRRVGCLTCAYPCKDRLTVKRGDYEGLTTNVSSMIGRLWNLGAQAAGGCSFGKTVKLIDAANRYGVDTHQFAVTVMMASELSELGIIGKEHTEGLSLEPGFEAALVLLHKVAYRQGIGDVLADGAAGLIRAFGKGCEKYSTHIKGSEQQMDARATDFSTAAFAQVTNPEGAGSLPGRILRWAYPTRKGYSLDTVREACRRMDLSKEATDRVFDKAPGYYNVPRLTRYAEDFHVAMTALGLCEYRTELLDWPVMAELFSSATGIELAATDMKLAGERIWNLYKLLNVREGFDRKADRFPPKWLKPWSESGKEEPLATCTGEPVSEETFGRWLDEYYDERGWDVATGTPGREKLVELGLVGLWGPGS
ncbi:MAG: aldehyde ferredoxin oxidoreductase C-terminal domain-containing protein [Chloroflexota bacterium]